MLTVFQTDEKVRMDKKSRPVIDGTLQGPDASIELVAFHLHRLGAAKAKVATFAADGAPWIWARWIAVIAQVKLDPARVVEVLDWCHGVHHLSLALAALHLAEDRRTQQYVWLRTLLEGRPESDGDRGLGGVGLGPARRLAGVARDQLFDPTLRGGRLRYNCFRYRGVPLGSGAIESTIRRVINLRLKGNSIYWTEANAEAVFQLRAAVVSGRWEEIVERTRAAMARDRRTDCRWTPPECLAQLKALDEKDDDVTQTSTRKQSKRSAA